MIIRVWTTGLVPGKRNDYLAFAKNHSLPMFKRQAGILGVNVLLKEGKSLLLTYWKENIAAMEKSILYM